MTSDERKALAQKILCELNKRKTRATYGAVAPILGVAPVGVSHSLGKRGPWASWVVNKDTGRPSGYEDCQMHRNLFDNCRVIESGSELREFLGWSDRHSP